MNNRTLWIIIHLACLTMCVLMLIKKGNFGDLATLCFVFTAFNLKREIDNE